MSTPFDPNHRLIIVQAEVAGPSGSALLRLALDTGATRTLVNERLLMAVGYDPTLLSHRIQVAMGSSVEFVSLISVKKMASLGQQRSDFPVLCHTLPPSTGVDGLLGLDFFRGQTLTLDFRIGQITLG